MEETEERERERERGKQHREKAREGDTQTLRTETMDRGKKDSG